MELQENLNQIFHPSDFTEASYVAFVHSLKLAVSGQGKLTILHTGNDGDGSPWRNFPGVRQTLEQWGMLPPGSSKEAVAELGLEVAKVAATRRDPVESVLHYLEKHPHDMIVLATHQYDGFNRLMHKTFAEPIARQSGQRTLFIPFGIDGFISVIDGAVSLKNILIPVDARPHPQVAVDAAVALTELLGSTQVNIHLLHIGEPGVFPRMRLVDGACWNWNRISKQGNVEEEILGAAVEVGADLIVMATQGHHGFMDALRGSTTERIVRTAKIPVLAVPAYNHAAEMMMGALVWSS